MSILMTKCTADVSVGKSDAYAKAILEGAASVMLVLERVQVCYKNGWVVPVQV